MAEKTENSVDEEMPSSLREMMNNASQLDFFNEDIAKLKNSGVISSSDNNSSRLVTDEDKTGPSFKMSVGSHEYEFFM